NSTRRAIKAVIQKRCHGGPLRLLVLQSQRSRVYRQRAGRREWLKFSKPQRTKPLLVRSPQTKVTDLLTPGNIESQWSRRGYRPPGGGSPTHFLPLITPAGNLIIRRRRSVQVPRRVQTRTSSHGRSAVQHGIKQRVGKRHG